MDNTIHIETLGYSLNIPSKLANHILTDSMIGHVMYSKAYSAYVHFIDDKEIRYVSIGYANSLINRYKAF